MIPLRRIAQLKRTNSAALQPNNAHQNRAQDQRIFSIKIVPDLSVTVNSSAAVDIDVFAAQLEEGRCVLVDLLECVFLPVVCVVGKLNCTKDLC